MVDLFRQELINRPVGGDERATVSEIARWVGVGALLIGLILSYAWSHNEILRIRYEMEQLRRESGELAEINAALRAEYSSLIHPGSIARAAVQQGLVAASPAQILSVERPLNDLARSVIAQSKAPEKIVRE